MGEMKHEGDCIIIIIIITHSSAVRTPFAELLLYAREYTPSDHE